jgi:hypothetical protein
MWSHLDEAVQALVVQHYLRKMTSKTMVRGRSLVPHYVRPNSRLFLQLFSFHSFLSESSQHSSTFKPTPPFS